MDLRQLTTDFSVSPQITPEDVMAIAEAGYKSILCNRPDGEERGQPEYDEIAKMAEAAGLAVRWVPIGSAALGQDDIAAFDDALDELPAPLLAYCRSGTRCSMMWTIVQFGRMSNEEILRATSEAGYDMSGLLGQLSQQA